MDSTRRNSEGIEPVKPYIDAVAAMKQKSEIIPLIAKNYRVGLGNFFGTGIGTDIMDSNSNQLGIYQGGLSLSEKEYYSEAIEAGRILEERETKSKCDAQFYQKLGYCLQKECDYSAAIDSYTKADILQPDSLWTMRHIAQCYRLMGNFEDALHYYIAAEEVAPENLTLLLQTGECLAILKRYEEAFARFFKVEYLDTNSHRATRAIAWCSFLTAKDEQAQRYYDRLLQQEKVRHEDYINAAHVQWIAGNRSKAVELYKKAASMCSKEQFKQQMKHDEKILIERGASQFELMLLREIIE
jgi:tetratricopeptide (TPR) repeat protein